MPWFNSNTTRKRLESPGVASLDDVMGSVRVVLNHAGGIFNTMANMAVQLSRLDARVEGIARELAELRGHRVNQDQDQDEDVADAHQH